MSLNMRPSLADGPEAGQASFSRSVTSIEEVFRYSGCVLTNGLTMTQLGARLRAERQARGISLDRLAELSDVSRSMVSEVERGTKTPSVLVLDRLATALGTSIARLLDDPVSPRAVVMRAHEHRVVRDQD